MLKKKNVKGSRAWEQFRVVYNNNNKEVFGMACYSICKSRFVYKKVVDGRERSMGTKNMLDHMKCCNTTRRSGTNSDNSSSKAPDSSVGCIGKRIAEQTRTISIREKTATLIASAHLPYRFVENEEFKKLA